MSIKIAVPDHEILDLLARRWSPRAFADRPIDAETIRRLFEAARWTQSSANEQPWSFLIAQKSDTAEHDKLGSSLNPGNAWAKEAPLLGLVVASKNFSKSGNPNRVALYDCGAAMMALTVQATDMGLHMHQMGGFDVEKARAVMEVPEGHDPVAMFAVGYLGDPNTLSDELKSRELAPRTRKRIGEFVFKGKWGQALSL